MSMVVTPVPAPEFGRLLRQFREEVGRTVISMPASTSVSQATYRSWEDGTATPTRSEFGRLCLSIRRIRCYPPETFGWATGSPKKAPRPAAPDPVMPKPSGRPRTFGDHLRVAREADGATQDEVGAVIGDGVTGQAVGAWELNKAVPVREHYEALLVLFPDLRTAPEPDWRDIAPPSGGRDVARPFRSFLAPLVLNDAVGDAILRADTPDPETATPTVKDEPVGVPPTQEDPVNIGPASTKRPPVEVRVTRRVEESCSVTLTHAHVIEAVRALVGSQEDIPDDATVSVLDDGNLVIEYKRVVDAPVAPSKPALRAAG